MDISVVSWNIERGEQEEKIISFLKGTQPNIIGLQEVVAYSSDPSSNKVERIARELGYSYVFCPTFTTDRHTPSYTLGNAILSKFPFQTQACHLLSDLSAYEGTSATEPRGCVSVTLTIGDKKVHVLTTHLSYSHPLESSPLRMKQVNALLPFLANEHTILLGDFNSDIKTMEMQKITSVLENAEKGSSLQPTWSTISKEYQGLFVEGLTYRIDHMFISKDIEVKEFSVPHVIASDHLPLFARFTIT